MGLLEQLAQLGLVVKRNEILARYTAARLGGPAEALVRVDSSHALKKVMQLAWEHSWPVRILGKGANVLIGDRGFAGLIVINDTHGISREEDTVTAESGVGLIQLARYTVSERLAGFEWAINVPGTFGGGIVNNAGAYDGDIARVLVSAEVLSPGGLEVWPVTKLGYHYRESVLKRYTDPFVVLSGTLKLSRVTDPAIIRAKVNKFLSQRKLTQPTGASLGSMFKNPSGDYAGRLIDAAGLKGAKVGGVIVSSVHANFFVNTGEGTAKDYLDLIYQIQEKVKAKFGVDLELEVELLGMF